MINIKQTRDNVVSKYVCMYDAHDVVKKALKDTYHHKEISIYGRQAKMQRTLSKLLPHSFIKRFWIKQQQLDKKYK